MPKDPLAVWLDDQQIPSGSIKLTGIANGIENSACGALLVTKNYYKKVNTGDDNDLCKIEVENLHRLAVPLVTVLMEQIDDKKWLGLLGLVATSTIYVDLRRVDWNDQQAVNEACRQVYSAVRTRFRVKI